MAKSFRLYVVSDIHGAERAWRKFLNAIRSNVYKADAALYAGDLAGKAVVPVLAEEGGGWSAEVGGRREVARDEEELARLERAIADLGYYSYVTTREDARSLSDERIAEIFREKIVERLRAWLVLADERLAEGGTPVYLIPGNDDDLAIDEVLRASAACRNVDGRVTAVDGYEVLGFSWSQPTPWATPREADEDDLLSRITSLAEQVADARRAIFLLHVPPYASGLDEAPLLDASLRPTVSAGDVLRGPVGSKAVRAAIEQYQPLLGVHGHIHESAGHVRIGTTVCVNPGSEAASGILRGYVIDLGKKGVERLFRVEG